MIWKSLGFEKDIFFVTPLRPVEEDIRMFDFYFVQPADLQRKRDELNKKLADAGKPPMK